MKLGNVSQTIVPVPNFFLNKNLTHVDTFNVTAGKRYYREKELLKCTKDLNFSNNPRKYSKKYDEINKEKYVPIHRRILQDNSALNSLRNHSEEKPKNEYKIENPTFDEKKLKSTGDFGKYTTFMEKTNVSKVTRGDIREGIQNNIKDLLEKINTNYDMKRYNSTDKKTNSVMLNSIMYTPLTLYNQQNENETQKFKKALLAKLNSLSVVNPNSKQTAIRNFRTVNENHLNKSSNNLPNLGQTMNKMDGTTTWGAKTFNEANNKTFYNNSSINFMNEFSTNYQDFLLPAKKSYWRRKQKENEKLMRENDAFQIRSESYASMQFRNNQNQEVEVSQPVRTTFEHPKMRGSTSEISELIRNRNARRSTFYGDSIK